MRIGLVSDIHANPDAMTKFRGYQRLHDIETWWVLGDSVGYGPNPIPVLEWLLSDAVSFWHVGNHDLAYSRWFIVLNFSLRLTVEARLTCVLHRALLRDRSDLHEKFIEHIETITDTTHLQYAKPYVTYHDDLTVVTVHSNPHGESYADWISEGYTRPALGDMPDAEHLKNALNALRTYRRGNEQVIGFVGHSHIQFIASMDVVGQIEIHSFAANKPIDLSTLPETVIVNLGSVGKPLDDTTYVPFSCLDTEAKTLTMFREGYSINAPNFRKQYPDAEAILNDTDYQVLRQVFGLGVQSSNEDVLAEIEHELDKLSEGIALGKPHKWVQKHFSDVYKRQTRGWQMTAVAAPYTPM